MVHRASTVVDPVKEGQPEGDKESKKLGNVGGCADFASAARERLKRKAVAPEASEAKLERVKKASLSFAGAEDDF